MLAQFRCASATSTRVNHRSLFGGVWSLCLLVFPAQAEVRVSVQDINGVAWIGYQCTAGEAVRAFGLDILVDRGQISGISNFFRGPSQPGNTGYGIFPASFRDHLAGVPGTNIDWNAVDYSPLANPQDSPGDTLPGLNSPGVTLEFGGLWDPTLAGAMPGSTGTLCALQLSQPAKVSISANLTRGGVVSAFAETIIQPVFIGGAVGPLITGATFQSGVMTVSYHGGELQTATALTGPWTDTGDFSGLYVEAASTNQTRFYRVRTP